MDKFMIALEQDKVGIMKVQRPCQRTNSAYDTHVFEPTLEVDHDNYPDSLISFIHGVLLHFQVLETRNQRLRFDVYFNS